MKYFVFAAAILIGLAAPAWAGFAEGVAAYERGDYATALSELRPLAEAGRADAQTYIGVMYYVGQGVPRDHAEAMKWFRKAANQGAAVAQDNLGIMYGAGEGVPRDHVRAHMWSSLSAAQGNKDAAKSRDVFAKLMTPAQIAEARRLAREWKPKEKGK